MFIYGYENTFMEVFCEWEFNLNEKNNEYRELTRPHLVGELNFENLAKEMVG